MPRALVLGGGMVGSVMAADLAADESFDVAVADVRRAALDRVEAAVASAGAGDVATVVADLADPAVIARLAEDADVVLGALPSRLGFAALRAAIEAGRPYCDISFMPEDAWTLDADARRRGVTAIVDCGVAPGMSNLLAAAGAARLDRAERVEILVGGLPVERRLPFEYKAAFSPHDVIEEYVRPARLVEHGEIVVRTALSEPELVDFAGVGTLEAFNTDGLRSLTETLDVPHMREKTLRYPGHAALMRAFRDAGLFDLEPRRVGDATVVPRDVLAALLFPQWTYAPGEADLTVMRVVVEGEEDGAPAAHRWDLLDRLDPATGFTSMARTTAFPCAIVARLLLSGAIRDPGVHAPERFGHDEELVDEILDELAARNVRYEGSVERGRASSSSLGESRA